MKEHRRVDFFASEPHFFDHMAPIWEKLNDEYKGTFLVTQEIIDMCAKRIPEVRLGLPTENICLVASFGDYSRSKGQVIFMEHGIGHTYSVDDHSSYAGGKGKDRVVLFLNQHHITDKKNKKTYPKTKHEIIGTPKMDEYGTKEIKGRTVCISFHWNCAIVPETRTTLPHYEKVFKTLAKSNDYTLVVHAHPREYGNWQKSVQRYFRGYDIRFITDFRQVLDEADIYINDNSSTMYEFMLTGKPVIVLNAPWYRKEINTGIRFWDFIPGIQVDNPEDLDGAIKRTLDNPNEFKETREVIAKELYPHHRQAAQRAATTIENYINKTGKK